MKTYQDHTAVILVGIATCILGINSLIFTVSTFPAVRKRLDKIEQKLDEALADIEREHGS